MQPLLHQKPHRHSRAKDHSTHLLKRLELWSKGSFDAQGRCIQDHLKWLPPSKKPDDRSRLFDHLMSEGKVSMALHLLTKDSKGGVLSLGSMVPCGQGNLFFRTTKDILFEKHHLLNHLYYLTPLCRLLVVILYFLNVKLVMALGGHRVGQQEFMPTAGDVCVPHSKRPQLVYAKY